MAGANKRHVALQDVDELRNLVEARFRNQRPNLVTKSLRSSL